MFAVVANEVKELAQETARATEDIGKKIEAIQGDTQAAVTGIGEISGIIDQISGISNTIASAVEEQTTTTNAIGRNVGEAAKGASEIAGNISSVAKAAQNTTSAATETQEASRALAQTESRLETLVGRFKPPNQPAVPTPKKVAFESTGAKAYQRAAGSHHC